MLINKIIPFSCIDGPGNRMVIFFQGCNFQCGYCHNPETIHLCNHCGMCVESCPAKALSMKNGCIVWEEKMCIDCDTCIRTCANLSSPKTRSYTIDKLMKIIKKSEAFLDGITVSGGECTLNESFLVELFHRVKEETTLTCFVDTNGGLDLSKMEDLIAVTDAFMLDVKAIDVEEHRKLTGMSNDTVKKNLDTLLKRNKLYEVRTVLAPGLELEKTVLYVAAKIQDACIYKLLKYRPFGVREKGTTEFGMEITSNECMDELVSKAKEKGASKTVGI